MKLKFKVQTYQTNAVESVVNCFAGQPKSTGMTYRIDPGAEAKVGEHIGSVSGDTGFRNSDIALTQPQLLENIRSVQQHQNVPLSNILVSSKVCPVNLDIEMETGTGKTYCYIKTMFELHERYGWSKFIVVVPSIAIREGVYKSLEITGEHFLEEYGKRARFFIYNSKQLHDVESFSSDSGINVMVINVQAFAARGKDQRRIYEELDDFQSRRPIDVIQKNRPILILDEPQKMEGKKTVASLAEFNPLMILRYSATHKTEHNRIHRLDALDAYNQKLVKKIEVRGINVKGLTATNSYLYLESIEISASKPPVARVEYEVRQKNGIKRITRKLGRNDNLYELSDGLEQYKGFVVADIDAVKDTLSFSNGVQLQSGDATGDVNETTQRRIQIRETIKAHFDKERQLFDQGIKVLSLFFIDEVAKYRQYDETGEVGGEYASMFEEEYKHLLNETLTLEDTPYNRYLKKIDINSTHDGYFSIDKKTKHLVDPKTKARSTETDDVDAYDLILKDKERLLSFDEPVRFIFSHSALREGWDNPNVFVICTLKHSDNTVSRRQEVGRGLRLSVNQHGDRSDQPSTVHQINVLTVVASESYKDFVSALQKDISATLSERPRVADESFFTGKVLQTTGGDVEVTAQMAKQIYRYLLKNDYTDDEDRITQTYHDAKRDEQRAELPGELLLHAEQVFQLIDSIFSDAQLPTIGDARKAKPNPLNSNFHKKEFQALWSRVNRKAVYAVDFDTGELIDKCVVTLDRELKVSPLQYTIISGTQTNTATYDSVKQGQAFQVKESQTESYKASIHAAVRYDLVGKLVQDTLLTRKTVATILQKIHPKTFSQYRINPEDFMLKAARLINEQKATVIVQHLSYNPMNDQHDVDIFTQEKPKDDLSKAFQAKRHIYDYVFTDSKIERQFVEELDISSEVVVYAKLPRSFFIPTPVGDYNPDWAVAFEAGKVKHIYFIAETKGSMSSLELRDIEKCKIECARKFFLIITSDQVKYDVVDSYGKLMELVQ
ncbi:MAG: restriction endonuclease subunit R [Gammaproteobacteria bacterium (ex Lamellibrachia satsuma)]|nr:MAG: DEAD/DEAH box helicase family protein [Gammaproteobacteria bacterium (ex Lamellibrachia satsuma)]RRS32376.1 MAG: restriction endonuclease subunit R [Gammaproteobacteria bacterium (ex Lamellibrachia satsuma)]RRS35305.1 MAG: restriction endonuclease subunit R [Gammaproteobacteria bacterium (ex Lamellibrachia satsuma)]